MPLLPIIKLDKFKPTISADLKHSGNLQISDSKTKAGSGKQITFSNPILLKSYKIKILEHILKRSSLRLFPFWGLDSPYP